MTERHAGSGILSSLGDFARAGLRPRTPLAKAIVFTLYVKLAVIVTMRVFLFSGEARVPVSDQTISQLLGTTH